MAGIYQIAVPGNAPEQPFALSGALPRECEVVPVRRDGRVASPLEQYIYHLTFTRSAPRRQGVRFVGAEAVAVVEVFRLEGLGFVVRVRRPEQRRRHRARRPLDD